MGILEILFSRTLVKIYQNMTNLEKVLFVPVKSKKQLIEFNPISMRFELCKYKHIYIGRLHVKWEEIELPKPIGRHSWKETKLEVRSIYKNKCDTIAIANKLYRKAVKTFIRNVKPKGFKDCLLEYYRIEESKDYEYIFFLNNLERLIKTEIPKNWKNKEE